MMPEREITPTVAIGEPLTVFYRDVDAVVRTGEVPASRLFLTRAVRERRFKDPSKLFYDDRSLGEGARFRVRIDVWLFYIYVMIFGEGCLVVIEPFRRQGGPQEDPRAVAGWQLHLAIRVIDCGRLASLSGHRTRDRKSVV